MMRLSECIICRGRAGDNQLSRVEVWHDNLWRLTVSLASEVVGFSYLEPKRHISHVTELDGEESTTLGTVLARCSVALKKATKAEVVYIYVFGDGVPHLHIHLAPHRSGDALNDRFIKGDIVEQKLPNGFTRLISEDFPALPRSDLEQTTGIVRALLAA